MATKVKKAKKTAPEKAGEFDTLSQVRDALSGCSLTFHWWGILRVTDRDDNEKAAASLNADSSAIRTQRKLLDTKMEVWQDLQRIRNAAKQWYDWFTFPYVVTGQRLFRKEMRDDIWNQVKTYTDQLGTAAKRMTEARPALLEWAEKNLGDAFDEALYPEDFSDTFGMEIREHSIEPPSYLRHSNAEEYQQTLRRSILDIQDSMHRFENQCMSQIGTAVSKIATTLANDGGIRVATIDNMQNTFRRIAQMKFEGTEVFKNAMSEAEEIIDGVSIFDLRNSQGAREETKKKLESLMARYKTLQEAAVVRTSSSEVGQ